VENWDEWQPPTHDEQEAECTEELPQDYEPHCDDPNFVVCITNFHLRASLCNLAVLLVSLYHCVAVTSFLQCFDTIGWASGRASAL